MISQSEQILKHLKDGGQITPIEALEHFGCFRLAARISDLRKQGHNIIATPVTQDGKTFCRYHLAKFAFLKDMFFDNDSVRQHEWSKI